jgi:hypothetical protein
MPTPYERYFELIREKIEEDRYPSSQLMDRLEDAITSPEQLEAYLETLFEKIQDDHYPSLQMLDRVARIGPIAHVLNR